MSAFGTADHALRGNKQKQAKIYKPPCFPSYKTNQASSAHQPLAAHTRLVKARLVFKAQYNSVAFCSNGVKLVSENQVLKSTHSMIGR